MARPWRVNFGKRTSHMITKDSLMEKADALIDKLREEQVSFLVLLFSPSGPHKIDSYAEKLIDFQKEIRTSEDDDETLLELYKKFIALERITKKRTVVLGALPSLVMLYIAIVVVFLIVTSVDLSKFVESTLGVKAPEKLITLGIAGAFVYLATSGLSRIEAFSEKLEFPSVFEHTIRFSLAIVVPIILVVLFFNENGTLKEVTVSPELLSFGCGYSAKLVVDLFNKIVEKGSKLVSAL